MTRFSREVQLAAQYFYEQGLNENDIGILAEELGLDGFNDLVDDIIEGQLYEARRGPGGIRLVRNPGTNEWVPRRKALPSMASTKEYPDRTIGQLAYLAAQNPKNKGYASSLSKARKALKNPETPSQPPKTIAQRRAEVEAKRAKRLRDKTAIITPRETRAALNDLATGVNKLWRGHEQAMAARKAGEGVLGQLRAGLAGAFLKEQVQQWVENLLDEGYDLSAYTWDDMYEIYMEESFNGWVTELIDEGYDLSEYTWDDMRDLYEENLLTEGRIRRGSGKKAMPSRKRRSRLAKRARAGEDIGKQGKMFKKIAAGAARRYGSEEAGKRVAAAAMFRSMAEEADINELLRTATKHPNPKIREQALKKFNELSKIQIGSSDMAKSARIPRP